MIEEELLEDTQPKKMKKVESEPQLDESSHLEEDEETTLFHSYSIQRKAKEDKTSKNSLLISDSNPEDKHLLLPNPNKTTEQLSWTSVETAAASDSLIEVEVDKDDHLVSLDDNSRDLQHDTKKKEGTQSTPKKKPQEKRKSSFNYYFTKEGEIEEKARLFTDDDEGENGDTENVEESHDEDDEDDDEEESLGKIVIIHPNKNKKGKRGKARKLFSKRKRNHRQYHFYSRRRTRLRRLLCTLLTVLFIGVVILLTFALLDYSSLMKTANVTTINGQETQNHYQNNLADRVYHQLFGRDHKEHAQQSSTKETNDGIVHDLIEFVKKYIWSPITSILTWFLHLITSIFLKRQTRDDNFIPIYVQSSNQQNFNWRQKLPFLTVESSFRVIELPPGENRRLVVVPFGTGVDAATYPLPASCHLYFPSSTVANGTVEEDKLLHPLLRVMKNAMIKSNQPFDFDPTANGCGGGILAADSATGDIAYAFFTRHELFSLVCSLDVTGDGVVDCISGGRMSTLVSFDGRTGRILWMFDETNLNPINSRTRVIDSITSNFYTPLILEKDVDFDGLNDVLVVHGGDPLRKPNEKSTVSSSILILSSRTGRILKFVRFPRSAEESYYSPQQVWLTSSRGKQGSMTQEDEPFVLFGSGGETRSGSLYLTSLHSIVKGTPNGKKIPITSVWEIRNTKKNNSANAGKGFIPPPLLYDVTGDGVDDIIINFFDGSDGVGVFDGSKLIQRTPSDNPSNRILWMRAYLGSESYSSPAIGKWTINGKSSLIIFVVRAFGRGFPIYSHSKVYALEATTGRELFVVDESLVPVQATPLTVSVTGKLNDWFLYWRSTCVEQTETGEREISVNDKGSPTVSPSSVMESSIVSVHESSRADFCSIRYGNRRNPRLISQLVAVSLESKLMELRKIVIYDSRKSFQEEHDLGVNFAQDFLAKNWMKTRPDTFFQFTNQQKRLRQQHRNKWEENIADKISDRIPLDEDVVDEGNAGDAMIDSSAYVASPQQQQSDENLSEKDVNEKNLFMSRRRRHIGIHVSSSVEGDVVNGIQRVISTPTLVANYRPQKGNSSAVIDVVFGVFWFPASKVAQLFLSSSTVKNANPLLTQLASQLDVEDDTLSAWISCVVKYSSSKMEEKIRFTSNDGQKQTPSTLSSMDHDEYQRGVRQVCARDTRLTARQLKDLEEWIEESTGLSQALLLPDEGTEQNGENNKNHIWTLGQMTLYSVSLSTLSKEESEKSSMEGFCPFNAQSLPSYLGRWADSYPNKVSCL